MALLLLSCTYTLVKNRLAEEIVKNSKQTQNTNNINKNKNARYKLY